jgi:hypothetical protein
MLVGEKEDLQIAIYHNAAVQNHSTRPEEEIMASRMIVEIEFHSIIATKAQKSRLPEALENPKPESSSIEERAPQTLNIKERGRLQLGPCKFFIKNGKDHDWQCSIEYVEKLIDPWIVE